jgi:hypothetical protein
MGRLRPSTYVRNVTKGTRRAYRAAVHSATGELAPGFPIGAALLETLGNINADVRDALAGERAKLAAHGYPDDLPLPALWWGGFSD